MQRFSRLNKNIKNIDARLKLFLKITSALRITLSLKKDMHARHDGNTRINYFYANT